MACPVMIACVYSLLPNPDTKENSPFWISPVEALVVATAMRRNPKYMQADVLTNVDNARTVKQIV